VKHEENQVLIEAQQLSRIGDAVLGEFGEVASIVANAVSMPIGDIEHFARVVFGARGEALIIGAHDGALAALASRMFDKSPIDLRETDWVDSLGELCNMLAGKLLIANNSNISVGIPSYFTAKEQPEIWQKITIEAEAWKLFGGSPIYFAVVARESSCSPVSRK
jgi:hypothetical protein